MNELETNLNLIVSTLICKDCGEINTLVEFAECCSSTLPMLFVGQGCAHFVIYWQDAFYNEKLKEQYLNKSMICPICQRSKLIEVEISKLTAKESRCKRCKGQNAIKLHTSHVIL